MMQYPTTIHIPYDHCCVPPFVAVV